MKWIAPILLSAALAGQAGPAKSQANAPRRPFKQYTIEQFLDTTSVFGASFSADESRILFSSNKTGIWNAYTVPITGGAWTPVTKSTKDSTYAVSFFPRDNRVLITRDQGGNELNHVYVLTEDGRERDLTPGDKLKAQFVSWTHDGSAFYIGSNERDPKFFDVYRYDTNTYARTMFFENEDGYLPSGVSDDGKWVSLAKPNTTNDSDIYLWNAATKATTHVSNHTGQVNYDPMGFDPASTYLYFVTDAGGEFAALKRYALADGRIEDVQSAQWDIVSSRFSHNGKYRATVINRDGRPIVSVVDTATSSPVPLPAVPSAGVSSVRFSRSETKLAVLVNGDRSPNNLYMLDLGSRNLTKLTDSLSPQIDPSDLVDAEIVRFKARDGMTIPNILWKPHQAAAAARAPALVWVHGGPGGQTTPAYNATIQYLVNHGYVAPAYGFRVDYAGHAVVLSGDTAYAPNLVAHGKGADLLVHCVAIGSARLEQLRWDFVRRFYEYLANPETVAKILAETKPRDAVFSHISLYSQADIPAATEEELTARVRAGYDGPFVIGQDLMSFTINNSGVTREPYSVEFRQRASPGTMH